MIDIVEVLAFFVGTGVLPALLVGLVGSVVVTVVVVRRGWLQTPPWLVLAAVLSVVGILVFTLFRESVLIVQEVASGTSLVLPGWRGLSHWSPDGWWRATADPLRSTQVLLNIALFVPAGFVWTYLTRRPVRVLAALAALSVAIEVIQAVTGLGANDVADIIANLAGAAVGTSGAVAAGWAADAITGQAVGTRRWVTRATVVAAAGVCAVVLPGLGASQRQGSLADQARQNLEGTSLADVQRWEREGEMERVWRAVPSVYSDGFSRDTQTATARYPARFLGRRTCILVTWAPDGVAVQPASGTVCQRTSL
ncbi:MAG: VanZ family protein [Dermatophilaceae bacterium]